MKKLKVLTFVGTRPELIKLSRVITELDEFTNHVLVHTGQNYDYELNEVFFKELKIRKPNHFLGVACERLADTLGQIISKSDEIIEKEKPDALLVYGDTNSCLCVIPAKRRKIPIFHMEAGNRAFDLRIPEEINRKIVDHLSDINMTLTEHARRYLIQEGIPADRIFKIGSSMPEVIATHKSAIEASDVLSRLSLNRNEFFVVSLHREENVDVTDKLKVLVEALDTLAHEHKFPVLVSVHPRTKKRLDENHIVPKNSLVKLMKPLGFFDYMNLQMNSACVISDSGTLTEESSICGFSAVMVRGAHERPEGMDQTNVVMSEVSVAAIFRAVELVIGQNRKWAISIDKVQDYESYDVSRKVVRIITSYTDFINKKVWFQTQARDNEM